MPSSVSSAVGSMPRQEEAVQYDRTTILYHWLTAFLIAALWLIGQTRGYLPRGALRTDYLSLHMVLGVTLACALILRIVWRLTAGRRLPPADDGVLHLAARAVHGVLYLLMIGTVGLGITTAWQHGSNVFNLFSLPSFAPGNRVLAHQLGSWHALAANTVMVVAGLHAAAGIGHHLLMRDNVLRRMVPFLKG